MRALSETGRDNLQCPFCKTIAVYTVLVKYQPVFHDCDLLPHAEGFDDLLLSVHECPSCGGCFFHDELFLSEIRNISLPLSSFPEIKDEIAAHEYPDVYVNRFLFCAYFLDLHSKNSFVKAHFWHQAAWAARVRMNTNLESFCLEKALQNYLACYQDPTCLQDLPENTLEMEEYLPFIIGELCRRLNRFEEAESFYQKVKDPSLSKLAAKLIQLSRYRDSSNHLLEFS